MNNKLVIVCYFSHMENFIWKKYGHQVFFMTPAAAVLHLNADEILEIRELILKEKIQEIIMAIDTSCSFIIAALKNEKQFGSYAENLINKIVFDNKDAFENANALEMKQKMLAELIIKSQVKELLTLDFFLSKRIENKISINGIVTSKAQNQTIEFNLNNTKTLQYGLSNSTFKFN